MQRAALLPSCPHCFASSAVSLRLVSWNVHLHHLSLSGRHAMCCLIDVWIRSLRRGRLSHGSVRQNMCEQKWGHLGRIRNCEDEGGGGNKNKAIWVEFCSPACVCLFDRASVAAYVCVVLVFLSVFLHAKMKARRWGFFSSSSSASSNVSQPGQASQQKNDRYTGVVWQGSSAGLTRCTKPRGALTLWGPVEEHLHTHTHTQVFSPKKKKRASMWEEALMFFNPSVSFVVTFSLLQGTDS